MSALADAVIRAATDLAYKEMTTRFGVPRTVANLPGEYTILGLGKLGGAALGYASDIEILYVFDDNGLTDGVERIANAEFFERTFRLAASLIEAKREGIFEVDLRLRPHGQAGPVAVSLMSFCTYFGPDGDALSYERLSLVRLRCIGGNRDLGNQVERLRDEFIYNSDEIDLAELRALRIKQLVEKGGDKKPNAKFSPGALVDLEYTVQILQLTYGRTDPRLRTPRIHEALRNLVESGVMEGGEAEAIREAYEFFRDLINGLRMLRGNAQDLFMPSPGSSEFLHLARRIGYKGKAGLSPSEELNMDFEAWTATIRRFVEDHLGRNSIPGNRWGSIADLVFSQDLDEEVLRRILDQGRLLNERRALANINSLTASGSLSRIFAPLAVLAWDLIRKGADPDRALNNWERFASAVSDREKLYRELLSQPQKLKMLLTISAGSQFLANTLIGTPEFLDWVSSPEVVLSPRDKIEMLKDLESEPFAPPSREEKRDAVRRFRRREILRIGTRDLCLAAPLEETTRELSDLAEAILENELSLAFKEVKDEQGSAGSPDLEKGFFLLAFGKLGGKELNYSSDLDLLAVYAKVYRDYDSFYWQVFERFVRSLSLHTPEGGLYRIDLRLRPFGSSGALVSNETDLLSYYRNSAKLWEFQALLKLRPVAGNLSGGAAFTSKLRGECLPPFPAEEVRSSIDGQRVTAAKQVEKKRKGIDVKNGFGGIRDIEFLLQGLQLIHGKTHPEILTGNTLEGIEKIAKAGLLPDRIREELKEAYCFLRRLEHFLQIFEDRQIHRLPTESEELTALAKRLAPKTSSNEEFLVLVEKTMTRIQEIRAAYL